MLDCKNCVFGLFDQNTPPFPFYRCSALIWTFNEPDQKLNQRSICTRRLGDRKLDAAPPLRLQDLKKSDSTIREQTNDKRLPRTSYGNQVKGSSEHKQSDCDSSGAGNLRRSLRSQVQQREPMRSSRRRISVCASAPKWRRRSRCPPYRRVPERAYHDDTCTYKRKVGG